MEHDAALTEAQPAQPIRESPAAPADWLRSAREPPPLRRGLDRPAAPCAADAQTRAQTLADLEGALRDAGLDPTPAAVRLAQHRPR